MDSMTRSKLRTIFIGDVHGCFFELIELLEKVNFDPLEDRLIFLGDIINKGPYSGRVLELIHSIACEVVLGNHELGLLKYVGKRERCNANFDQVLEQMGKEKKYYLDWLRSLPTFIDDPQFLAIHGGLIPGLSPEQHDAGVITRIRTWGGNKEEFNNPLNPAWFELYREEKLVVYGHWAAMGLTVRENTVGIDSGCVWGGSLSALILPSREIFQVQARATYVDPVDYT